MRTPLALLESLARASRDALPGVGGGDFLERVPTLVGDVWRCWGEGQPEARLRDEVQALASLGDPRVLADQVAAAAAARLPAEQRALLAAFLAAVPAAIRRSQRRPADPSGRTLVSLLPLRRGEDLLPLLPSRLPRFQPGQRAPGFGDWVLEELLGLGASGEVWKATHPHLPAVALKFCLAPSAVQTLQAEAGVPAPTARQGRHPGLVALLGASLDSDPPCLQFEYVPGGDLGGLLRRREPLAARTVVRLMHRLAEAVGSLHRLDPPLVHRDLKPGHVLLQADPGGELRPRVADVAAGALWGGGCAPPYASPQQARGEPPQPRDDVYSLGVLWYQLLAGDPAGGPAADWRDVLAERRAGDESLDLMAACLSSRPERRPPDAAALAEELARLTTRPSRSSFLAPAGQLLTNSVGLDMVLVPPGRVRLGTREVEVSQPFYISVSVVTQEQYQRVMGVNPSWFSATGAGKDQVRGCETARFPVESVSWFDAFAFCEKLSNLAGEKKAGRVYRLPSEAEWECACSPEEDAEPGGGPRRTQPVSGGRANRFGVIDARGNVWEWCADFFAPLAGAAPAPPSPATPSPAASRVLRGRSWSTFGAHRTASNRRPGAAQLRSNGVSFRIALTAPLAPPDVRLSGTDRFTGAWGFRR
jgi:formylglycine-generating enzyme required for sulfatase activity